MYIALTAIISNEINYNMVWRRLIYLNWIYVFENKNKKIFLAIEF